MGNLGFPRAYQTPLRDRPLAAIAIHAADDLGKEFTVKIGKNDADRTRAGEAEAARARVGDVAQLVRGRGESREQTLDQVGARHH